MSLPFLDINLSIDQNTHTMKTSVHYKPTDSHVCLSFNSSHPPKCKNSIPYSQLLRLQCLCSDSDDFPTMADEMMAFFKARGYPDDILNSVLRRLGLSQKDQTQHQNNTSRIPLVLTYHPTNSQVVKVIMKNFKLLQECIKNTKDVFKDPLSLPTAVTETCPTFLFTPLTLNHLPLNLAPQHARERNARHVLTSTMLHASSPNHL